MESSAPNVNRFITRTLRTIAAAVTLTALSCGLTNAQEILTKHGSEVDGRLTTPLGTKTSHDGDTFKLSVTDLLFVHHPELKGATIDGHLENVTPASAMHKASMNVIFDDITLADGRSEPISVTLKNMSLFEPHTHHLRDMGIIIGSAVAGHIVSKKTGHGGGTVAGAAAGFVIVNGLKSDIVIKAGTLVKLRLQHDITQPA